jgi:hypothetical protein
MRGWVGSVPSAAWTATRCEAFVGLAMTFAIDAKHTIATSAYVTWINKSKCERPACRPHFPAACVDNLRALICIQCERHKAVRTERAHLLRVKRSCTKT